MRSQLKFKNVLSLILVQIMVYSNLASAANNQNQVIYTNDKGEIITFKQTGKKIFDDGFHPVIPKIDPQMGSSTGGIPGLTDGNPPDIIPAPGSNTPRIPLVQPGNSISGYYMTGVPSIQIADVSEEFACPLFESKAYDAITSSLDKLTNAVKNVTNCQSENNLGTIPDNADKIRQAVLYLKPVFEDPETAAANLPMVQNAVTSAIQGANNLLSSIGNRTFAQSDCGSKLYQSADIGSTLSNIVSGVAPFALMGMSIIPGLGTAVKTSALALIAGATAFTQFQKDQYGKTLDMNNIDQWKGVVVNMCAYARVERKMKYIMRTSTLGGSQVQPVVDPTIFPSFLLPDEVQNRLITFKQETDMHANDHLGVLISLSLNSKNKFGDMANALEKGRQDIGTFQAQAGKGENFDETASCSSGQDIARLSKNDGGFPNDLVESIGTLKEFIPDGAQTSYSALLKTYGSLLQSLQYYSAKGNLTDADVTSCSNKSKSLLLTLSKLIGIYDSTLKGIEAKKDAELMKDPDYKAWKEKSNVLKEQVRDAQQLYKVMTSISGSSSMLQAYLSSRQDQLKQFLMGTKQTREWLSPSTWLSPDSPVYKWLDFTLGRHTEKIERFQSTMSIVVNDFNLIKLRAAKKLTPKFASQTATDKFNLEYYKFDMKYLDLKNFDLQNADKNKRAEEKATRDNICGRLLKAWDIWVASINDLDATGSFCEMLRPLSTVATDPKITKFCRGLDTDVAWQKVRTYSDLGVAAHRLTTPDIRYGMKSIQDIANSIPATLKAMNCDTSADN